MYEEQAFILNFKWSMLLILCLNVQEITKTIPNQIQHNGLGEENTVSFIERLIVACSILFLIHNCHHYNIW